MLYHIRDFVNAHALVMLYWDFARALSFFGFVRKFWQMRIDLLITRKR